MEVLDCQQASSNLGPLQLPGSSNMGFRLLPGSSKQLVDRREGPAKALSVPLYSFGALRSQLTALGFALLGVTPGYG